MLRFILVILTLAGGLLAQEESSCPDQVIQKVDPIITSQFQQTCGSNVSTTVGGVSISTPINICPLIVVIRPGYDTTTERRGSGTYTRPVKTVPILSLTFQCETSWLLGIIPIVISSTCAAQGRATVGTVTHYEQFSCRGEGSQTGAGDEPPDQGPMVIHS